MGWFKRLLGMEIEHDFEARMKAARANSRKLAPPEPPTSPAPASWSVMHVDNAADVTPLHSYYDRLLLDSLHDNGVIRPLMHQKDRKSS